MEFLFHLHTRTYTVDPIYNTFELKNQSPVHQHVIPISLLMINTESMTRMVMIGRHQEMLYYLIVYLKEDIFIVSIFANSREYLSCYLLIDNYTFSPCVHSSTMQGPLVIVYHSVIWIISYCEMFTLFVRTHNKVYSCFIANQEDHQAFKDSIGSSISRNT